ncbi:SLC13 family permease [Stackebrandtia nassauensis]|uniref:Dicarboxylate carrier MatC domain protein n=1 Tax=Stackebrandtia nassauensis (strain DSM 44728 / CIP 108903 / NRRL B-16338 / NBRC 102104 / LLR-40K-21) TaxID=446470 RepID=D3Q1T6_STANL|nr:SLC13 family permease [Stackebrandtia nassauensis]ADD39934.1 Dicarboxylate carrier MatC domain protein [Stackebrandtia nassauensis DSM 44728]
MSAELISILVLVAVFAIATTRSVNMGALSFTAAFAVGTLVAGLDAEGIFAGFPGDLFVVLVGVTYLFALARANGTTDWLVHGAVRLVGGRVALIPWMMFAVTGLLTAIGAVSPAAVAIVAPIALGFASRYQISPLLMGVMVVHGAQGGGFSPISVYGAIVNGIVDKEDLPGSPIVLFLASLLVNLVIAAILFVLCGGLKLPRHVAAKDEAADPERDALNPARITTLFALAALVVAVLGFNLDAGLTAITLAAALSVVWPKSSRDAVGQITWPTVLLICGVLTYVAVLEQMGTIDYAGTSVSQIGVPLLGALLICYIGALVSAFASSVGIMGALIPLAIPFLALGDIGAIGMVTALAISSTVVDVSPFSTNGALVLASAAEVDRERFFRQLMIYGGIVVAAVPPIVWLALVVPGFG